MINITKETKSKDQKTINNRRQGLKYIKEDKLNKNFMYRNLEKSDCYNCNFGRSNFDYASFRGAHFKSSNFDGCSFKFTEFVGTNLKNSSMKECIFKNAVFNSARIDGVSFKGAIFQDTIFINTDITKAKGIDSDTEGIVIMDNDIAIDISEELTIAIINVMNNPYVKKSRVLDTSDGGINNLSIKLLLEKFEEEKLIHAFGYVSDNLDRPFYTLSYLIKYINQKITW